MTNIESVTNPATRTTVYIKPPYQTHPGLTLQATADEIQAFYRQINRTLSALWELRLDPSELVNPYGWPDFSLTTTLPKHVGHSKYGSCRAEACPANPRYTKEN